MRKIGLLLVVFVNLGLSAEKEAKPEPKLSEANFLKISLAEKEKENLQLKFQILQGEQKQIGQDFGAAQERVNAAKKDVCKEAGFKDCTYDLTTRVVKDAVKETTKEEKK
jgi:hypothetical protein